MAPARLLSLALCGCALAAPAAASAEAPPQIEATWVEGVTASSAQLRALIDSEGAATYHFDYLTQAAYEANLKAAKDPFAGASRVPLTGEAKAKVANPPPSTSPA